MATPQLTTPQSSKSAIALGSNLGNSLSTLEQALITIDQTPGIVINQYSSWYKTSPVGGPIQPDYLNACALLTVELEPHQLLETLLDIESQFGRVRETHWGPRTLDLDVLLFEDLIIDTPKLQIPHPRMSQRGFVLLPLAEIAPDWLDPVSGHTIHQLLETVDTSGVTLFQPKVGDINSSALVPGTMG